MSAPTQQGTFANSDPGNNEGDVKDEDDEFDDDDDKCSSQSPRKAPPNRQPLNVEQSAER